MAEQHISRRGFLKATGALSAAAAALQLPDLQWLEKADGRVKLSEETKVVRSMSYVSRHVQNACPRAECAYSVEGNPEAPTNRGTLCPRGWRPSSTDNPRRLRCPMKRVGERGEGKWHASPGMKPVDPRTSSTMWEKYGVASWPCGGTGVTGVTSNAVIAACIGVSVCRPVHPPASRLSPDVRHHPVRTTSASRGKAGRGVLGQRITARRRITARSRRWLTGCQADRPGVTPTSAEGRHLAAGAPGIGYRAGDGLPHVIINEDLLIMISSSTDQPAGPRPRG